MNLMKSIVWFFYQWKLAAARKAWFRSLKVETMQQHSTNTSTAISWSKVILLPIDWMPPYSSKQPRVGLHKLSCGPFHLTDAVISRLGLITSPLILTGMQGSVSGQIWHTYVLLDEEYFRKWIISSFNVDIVFFFSIFCYFSSFLFLLREDRAVDRAEKKNARRSEMLEKGCTQPHSRAHLVGADFSTLVPLFFHVDRVYQICQ